MCRLHEMMILLLPLSRWKEGVRRRHLARCPRCAAESAALENTVRTFLTPAWTREESGWESKVRRGMDQGNGARAEDRGSAAGHRSGDGRRLRLQVAAGVALLFLAVGGPTPAEKAAGPGPRVQVFSAELRGKPAKAYIYQTPRISFVWISPSKEIGG
jgi:anti-sigma factor RsiW